MAQELLDGQGLLDAPAEKKHSQVGDFFQGLFHQAVESPVNGVTQIVNRVTGVGLPQMEIAGPLDHGSVGGAAGSIAGAAVAYFAFSKAASPLLANVGGAGARGAILRAGLTGAIYGSVFTQSDANSESFFGDRLSNGLVSGLTFAAMGAASHRLDQTGLFKVPEIRSFGGSVTMGALSGAAGGVAHAEATAIFKKGQLLPSISELASDAASFAAFGAATSAMGHAWGRQFNRLAEKDSYAKIETNTGVQDGRLRYYTNSRGEIVKIQTDLAIGKDSRVGFLAEKYSNGSWETRGMMQNEAGKWRFNKELAAPAIAGVTERADGGLSLITKDGGPLEIAGNGSYDKRNPNRELEKTLAEIRRAQDAKKPKIDDTDRMSWDGKNREVRFLPDGKSDGSLSKTTIVTMDKTGQVNTVEVHDRAGKSYKMERKSPDTWKVDDWTKDKDGFMRDYIWKGDIKAQNGSIADKIGSIELKPAEGAAVKVQKNALDYKDIDNAVFSSAKYVGYNRSHHYIRMDNAGKIIYGSGGVERTLTPGEKFEVTYDIGDRYRIERKVPMPWGKTLDGKTITLNNKELLPDSIFDLDIFMPRY